MSQSSLGFNEEDETDADALPSAAEDRGSQSMESPEHQLPSEENPVEDSARAAEATPETPDTEPSELEPDETRQNAWAGLPSIAPAPDDAPAPRQKIAPRQVGVIPGLEEPEVFHPSTGDAASEAQAEMHGQQVARGAMQQEARTQAMQIRAINSGPAYQGDDGRWKRQLVDQSGAVNEHDVIDSGMGKIDPKTGDIYAQTANGWESIGVDPKSQLLAQTVAQKNQLFAQGSQLTISIAASKLALTDATQKMKAIGNGIPEQLLAQVRKYTVLATDPNNSDASEGLQKAQDDLKTWKDQNPAYALEQAKQASLQDQIQKQEAEKVLKRAQITDLLTVTIPNIKESPYIQVNGNLPPTPTAGAPTPDNSTPTDISMPSVMQRAAEISTKTGFPMPLAMNAALGEAKQNGIQTVGNVPIADSMNSVDVSKSLPSMTGPQLRQAAQSGLISKQAALTQAKANNDATENARATKDNGANPVADFLTRAGAQMSEIVNASGEGISKTGAGILGQKPTINTPPDLADVGNLADLANWFKGTKDAMRDLGAGKFGPVNPAKNDSISATFAQALGMSGALAAGSQLGGPLAAFALMAPAAAADAYDDAKENGIKQPGGTFRPATDEEASHLAMIAGAKVIPQILAYHGAGKLVGAIESKFLPAIMNPVARAAARTVTGTAGNYAASTALRGAEDLGAAAGVPGMQSQPIFGTRNSFISDMAFAIDGGWHAGVQQHGVNAYKTSALDIVAGTNPAHQSLVQASQNPENSPTLRQKFADDAATMQSQAADFLKANKITPPAPGTRADPLAQSIVDLNDKADDTRTKIQTAYASGDPGAAGQLADHHADLQYTESQLHAATQEMLARVPADLQKRFAKAGQPDVDWDAARQASAENPNYHFATENIGAKLRDQVIPADRQDVIHKMASANMVDPNIADHIVNQAVGAKAVQDLGSVMRGAGIDPKRAETLMDLGLLRQTDPKDPTSYHVTEEALNLLPKGFQNAVKVKPDAFRYSPGEGDVHGDVTYQHAVMGMENMAKTAKRLIPKPAAAAPEPARPQSPVAAPVVAESPAPAGKTNLGDVMAKAGVTAPGEAPYTPHRTAAEIRSEIEQRKKEFAAEKNPDLRKALAGRVQELTAQLADQAPKLIDPDSLTEPQRAVVTDARRAFLENRPFLEALGVKPPRLISSEDGKSGISISIDDGHINLDPAAVAKDVERFDAPTRKALMDARIAEEATHRIQVLAEGADFEKNHAAIWNDPDVDPALKEGAAKAYNDFDKLSDSQKGAEMMRMVLTGKWHGTITERIFKAVWNFVDYLRGLKVDESKSPLFREMVARAEDVLAKAKAEAGKGEPAKPGTIHGLDEHGNHVAPEPPESAAPDTEARARKEFNTLKEGSKIFFEGGDVGQTVEQINPAKGKLWIRTAAGNLRAIDAWNEWLNAREWSLLPGTSPSELAKASDNVAKGVAAKLREAGHSAEDADAATRPAEAAQPAAPKRSFRRPVPEAPGGHDAIKTLQEKAASEQAAREAKEKQDRDQTSEPISASKAKASEGWSEKDAIRYHKSLEKALDKAVDSRDEKEEKAIEDKMEKLYPSHYAMEQSDAAGRASSDANRARHGLSSAHEDAANEHAAAAEDHDTAAVASRDAGAPDKLSDFHTREAESHRARAEQHRTEGALAGAAESAQDESANAKAASRRADRTGDASDHEEALHAHKIAAQEHELAAEKYDGVNDSRVLQHLEKADKHRNELARHQGESERIKSEELKKEDEEPGLNASRASVIPGLPSEAEQARDEIISKLADRPRKLMESRLAGDTPEEMGAKLGMTPELAAEASENVAKVVAARMKARGIEDESALKPRDKAAEVKPDEVLKTDATELHASPVREAYDKVVDRMASGAKDIRNEVKLSGARNDIAAKVDAVGTKANTLGVQAGNSIKLDIPDKMDREAMPFVIEAGKDKTEAVAKLAAERGKIQRSLDPKLAAKYVPIIDRAISDFDRLTKLRSGHDAIMEEQYKRAEAMGVEPGRVEDYVTRKLDAPDAPSDLEPAPLFQMGSGRDTGSRYFTKGRAFETLGDAIEAGYKPKSTDLADLAQHRIENGEKIIGTKRLHEALKEVKSPVDGKPVIGEKVPRPDLKYKNALYDYHAKLQDWMNGGKQGIPPKEPTLPMAHPKGYTTVNAGGTQLIVHDAEAPIFKDLYGDSAIRRTMIGRGLLKAAAGIKHGNLFIDTFHIGRVLYKMATAGGGMPLTRGVDGKISWNLGRGKALLEYKDADVQRAVDAKQITQGDADYAKANREKFERLLSAGMNVGKVADNLMEQAHMSVPGFIESGAPLVAKGLHGIGSLNDWIFSKLSRSAMLQSSFGNLDRNLANPKYSEAQAYRQTAVEMNRLFGNLQSQGILKDKTLQDMSRLIFLAPNWTESQFRNEISAYGQIGASAIDAAKGRGLRMGNATRVFATGFVGMLAANQIINLITRGQTTFQNKEDDQKFSAWLPGGARGFFFNPLEIAGEYAHASMKYLAQHQNPVDVGARIVSNKLSPIAHAAQEAISGRDYSGKHFLSDTDRFRSAATNLVPMPLPLGAVIEKDPRQPLGYRMSRQPGSIEKQALQSIGAKVTPAQSPRSAMFAIAQPFRADLQQNDAAGEYTELRRALDNRDPSSVKSEIQWLMDRGHSMDAMSKAVGIHSDGNVPPERFAGTLDREKAMIKALTPEEKKTYMAAQQDHQINARLFKMVSHQVKAQTQPAR